MRSVNNDDLKKCQHRIEKLISTHLSLYSDQPLYAAMRYAMLNGGKRLRPLLVYACGHAFHVALDDLDPIAGAVEMIHAYSLIHDDLPAMDNSDQRRSLPSCHKKFGEAIALLAGDALHTLAFELVSNAKFLPQQIIAMITTLTKTIGGKGMINGQAMEFTTHTPTLMQIEQIHRLKTGALMSACLQLAGLAAAVSDTILLNLEQLGYCLGLAYQIQDDLQDQEDSPFNYLVYAGERATKTRLNELYQDIMSLHKRLFAENDILCSLLNRMFSEDKYFNR